MAVRTSYNARIGVDKTSVNVAGTKQWLHVARTEELTAYHLHPSRGRAAVAEFDVLPRYSGTVVRDALAVYDAYPATHALCGAHLIRELTAVAEQYPQAQWPVQARSALADLAGLAAAAAAQGLTAIPAEQAAQPLRLYRHAVLVGLSEHRRAPGRKQSKARNLLERLRNREPEILRVTQDLAVLFTNNGSERDLRPVKTQLKISGCHLSQLSYEIRRRLHREIQTTRLCAQEGATVFLARDGTQNRMQPGHPPLLRPPAGSDPCPQADNGSLACDAAFIRLVGRIPG